MGRPHEVTTLLLLNKLTQQAIYSSQKKIKKQALYRTILRRFGAHIPRSNHEVVAKTHNSCPLGFHEASAVSRLFVRGKLGVYALVTRFLNFVSYQVLVTKKKDKKTQQLLNQKNIKDLAKCVRILRISKI